MIGLPLLLLFAQAAPAVTAEAIMARVADNQDRAQEMRTAFVYHQSAMIRLNRTNGKLAREEYSEFTVTPTPKGVNKERTLFRGKYLDHGKEVAFDEPGFEHKGVDVDADLACSLLESLTNDEKSRDGIESNLFPLRSKQQKKYDFRLEGSEDYRGVPVYRITFLPKKVSFDDDHDADIWGGEVLVDRVDYQPVLITTHQVAKVPMLVKTLLGTNVQQLGFKVTYKKFDEGLWFPVTYGGEFRFRGLFFYARRVGISLQNSGFQRAVVESKISFAGLSLLLGSLVP
ncbi:MAG TPA: hypothetical protein VEU96_00450 [Bryobacteraceae bacterium]|nr:hypothetical protein [Bryobacteraceae bacterium]